MDHSFSPNMLRPNLPLRKPSSSPMSVSTPPARHLIMPGVASCPVSPASGAVGDGPIHSLVSREKSTVLGSIPSTLAVYFCNYCGQQGSFRCKRCKKTPYCSVVCQTEDWKAHRHVCKSVDLEPAKEIPKETTASPVTGDRAGLLELKHADAPSPQRVYLKDLHQTKVVVGTDIQATVVEFYSPGRFFILTQSPELQSTLQRISTELQKSYSCPSVTYVPCVGEVCGVQFSCDLNWYRGLVQSLAADQKMANVLYLDFGNEETVPVDRIRPLVSTALPFCPCAMECSIAGVVPVAGNWSGECCIAVRQMLAGRTVTVRLVETLESGRIHAVDILLSTGKQLSTFLLEHDYAAKQTINEAPTQQEISELASYLLDHTILNQSTDAMMSASLENFRRLCNGKDNNTWAQPPEPLTQAVGDSFSVLVTHLQSPNEMIVQKVENAGVIQQLQLNLREHCCHIPAPQDFRPAPGTVCCAQFSEDKQWYRAKVLAYPSEERICVGYLDFGNSEEVDLGHLRPISTSLLALPMQAMPCGLAGVQPAGERWSEDCLLALQRRVSNRILRIEIQGAHEGKALVTMIDEASDPQANVAELLISAGYAASAPFTTNSEPQLNQATVAAAEPHAPAPAPASASESAAWSFAEIPSDGQTVALLTSVVKNPGEFYCRIDNPAYHQQLTELQTVLKQHCEADNSPFEPKVGEPCCAMCPGDGAWYRAMVKKLCENQVYVNIMDFGYGMRVEKHHLRAIKPQLLTLPFQAVRCWLAGVEPLGSEWSSEALLWFQTLVDGEQLSARVLSVTKQGHYGVALSSGGQDVAAALISEQLAKVSGVVPKVTHATTDSGATCQESARENEHSQTHAQASDHAGAGSKEKTSEGWTALPKEGHLEFPSFPVDWKTAELPLSETFKPYFAAVTSPSLFYLLGPKQVDQQKLRELMMEVAAYCSNNEAALSSAVLGSPALGAACCAQFSDSNWYRAVVIEVGESETSVIYADYGNTEKLPFSRILPIPPHLLQLPFLITRCTLTGKEHFPAEWPEEVRQMFQTLLVDGVLATVQSFDGSANVLSLTLPTEKGGGQLTAVLVDALQLQTKSNPCPATAERADHTTRATPAASGTAAPGCPQPPSTPETQKSLEHAAAPTSPTMALKPTPQSAQQNKNTSAESISGPVQRIIDQMEPLRRTNTESPDPLTSGCCCQSLKTKVDQLEQLMLQQLSLIKQLVGQTP